MADQKVIRYQD